MIFEWNEDKNKVNQRKHGIDFDTAKLVFNDPLQISIQDRHKQGEERWQTMGNVEGVMILLVAHTIADTKDDETIRIISARKATKRERKYYESTH